MTSGDAPGEDAPEAVRSGPAGTGRSGPGAILPLVSPSGWAPSDTQHGRADWHSADRWAGLTPEYPKASKEKPPSQHSIADIACLARSPGSPAVQAALVDAEETIARREPTDVQVAAE